MMSSVMGAPYQAGASPMYSTDFIQDEMSRQLALSEASMRLGSRGSTSQRTQNAMRVVKPSSASNSPQNMMARRRTLVNDENLARRRQQALAYALAQQMQGPSPPYTSCQEPVKRASRPVSWHPTSHLQQQQSQAHMPMHQHIPQPDFSQYVFPLPTPYTQADMCANYTNLPPTPVAYSGQTSPVNSYSPLSYPFTVPSQAPPQYVSRGTWEAPQEISPVQPAQYSVERSPAASASFSSASTGGQSYFHLDTSSDVPPMVDHMDHHCTTAPPTPEDFQQAQPLVPAEDSIPYQPLEEAEEEEGEILIGMGLYDAPDKTDEDPELDNYRTSASHLLGTTYRRGQGLKLEEAWEPPASDDEDDSEDADGEEQEQEEEQ